VGAGRGELRKALNIHLETPIKAAPATVFDLARSVGEHVDSLSRTRERVVSAPAHDLLVRGDEVTWEARHLGLRWRLRVRITSLEPPAEFVDEQVSGPFRRMRHRHRFLAGQDETTMVDDFEYELPLGPLGAAVDFLVVRQYLKSLLSERNRHLAHRAGA
jgi:ligand-binding SRPBCC domain-containing protein